MFKINEKKYGNLILYIASKLDGVIKGKKRLAKLLYFADFDFFEKYEKPITGEIYKALPMGPFPVHMEKMTKNLSDDRKLIISFEEPIKADYNPTEVYKSERSADESVFSEDEINIINRVVLKYGHLSGKQLEDLTHAEAPFIGTAPNEEIPYELSLYRGTDFSNND